MSSATGTATGAPATAIVRRHGFADLVEHLSDIVDEADAGKQKELLRSERSFYLWQSILRGAGVVTGCRRCQDVCPVGADYAGLVDALEEIPRGRRGQDPAPRRDAEGGGRGRLSRFLRRQRALDRRARISRQRHRGELGRPLQPAAGDAGIARRDRRDPERAQAPRGWSGRADRRSGNPRLGHVDSDRLDDPDEWRKTPDPVQGGAARARRRALPPRILRRRAQRYLRVLALGRGHRPAFLLPPQLRRHPPCHGRLHPHLPGRRGGARQPRASVVSARHPPRRPRCGARAAQLMGIGVSWVGAGAAAPSKLQLELIDRLEPTVWMGMPSYGVHLANLAEAEGVDLPPAARSNASCAPPSRCRRPSATSWRGSGAPRCSTCWG